ncbi:hypothetical protein FSARC_6880 [Fusarium sarcochroum]|uniref:Uncharacterized protein n=1 Tax=Fusarium sarcochroum TaxID=1208366 RepID=A0A8H4X7Y4_9HYPO|nr:hypothetical protein FSARC_6880 [Fusarium sarcochroum]
MSNITTTPDDGPMASFFFPDSQTALMFFNNDLTVSTLPSDEGYIADEYHDDDDSTVPSSYLTTFPVEAPRLSSRCEDDNTASSSTWRDSPSEKEIYYSIDTISEGTSSRPSTPSMRCSSIGSDSSSPGIDDNVSPMSLSSDSFNAPNTEVRASSGHELSVTEPDPYLPGYYVHQLNWNCPVNTCELSKRSKQHNREIKTLDWDTRYPFRSSNTTDSEVYKTNLAEWRALRQKAIYHEPSDQQRARDSRLLSSIARIQEKRDEMRRKGWRL